MKKGGETQPVTALSWLMLFISLYSATISAVFVNGVAFLIPTLHNHNNLPLAQVGLVVAMPSMGFVCALIAWGYVVDRVGERIVLTVGLLITALFSAAAALSNSLILIGLFLFLGGVGAASTNSASGRLVLGWFPFHRRGLAMGIRQMAQPLGVGIGALSVPTLASAHGVGAAMTLIAGLSLSAATICALAVTNPSRPNLRSAAETGLLSNPYRNSATLTKIHLVSILLVLPQAFIWTYALLWLISRQHWSTTSAGLLIVFTQILGAAGRMAIGSWSDHLQDRLSPIRWIALIASMTLLLLAISDFQNWPLSLALLVIASVITVIDNGLAFTSVAEIAGPYWSGRALGIQNTGQFLGASLVPPAFGAIIASTSFPLAIAITAIFPLLAAPLVPNNDKDQPQKA
ncbi:MAG: MFS transporter [Mycobacteriaceae bacterium]